MFKTHRAPTAAVLLVCLLGGPSSGILFASGRESSTPTTAASTGEPLPGTTEFVRSLVASSPHLWRDDTLIRLPTLAPDESSLLAQRGGRGRGYGSRRNGAAAAVFLGAAAAIAGTAVLVYANRPECNTVPTASGCGYGTKVVGGAVLSAGVVGLVVGAAMWR
ncbi:MAG TPA: hypothetical protein VFP91_17635 [Vicinamibacterales bacterium]|nr:hypothetical protein [Vicinamibacterales bacterium]